MISNTGFSIDALPAIGASTPRMKGTFVGSPYALNHVTGLAELLGAEGYQSAYFHGADNESLGIQAFARQAGFKDYYGINEYVADKRTGGMNDFDGTWGIWDEEFLQWFRLKLSETPQPFLAGIFTLSSHHPYEMHERYKDTFPSEPGPAVLPLVRYSDMALGKFFASASKESWFGRTLFVLCADHSFLHPTDHKEYNNSVGFHSVPILLYDPSGKLTAGERPGLMQQIDIMPTVLSLLGYDKPYFAWGKDALAPDAEPWAMSWTEVLQYFWGDYVLRFDTETWKPKDMYNYRKDPLLEHNLLGTGLPEEPLILRRCLALVQLFAQKQKANQVHL